MLKLVIYGRGRGQIGGGEDGWGGEEERRGGRKEGDKMNLT